MSKLYDEDGIDGPFERGMARAIKQDTDFATALRALEPLPRGTRVEVKLSGGGWHRGVYLGNTGIGHAVGVLESSLSFKPLASTAPYMSIFYTKANKLKELK